MSTEIHGPLMKFPGSAMNRSTIPSKAGLVLFSVRPQDRNAYQALFRDRQITKHYDAIAPWRADVAFPRAHASRLEESPQFFRMQEVPGEPNSHTHMQVLEEAGGWARYRLSPITGKRHQLRVHMAALGLPLRNDPFYPEVNDPPEGDYSRPLQLLARSLRFTDPLNGQERSFETRLRLQWPVDEAQAWAIMGMNVFLGLRYGVWDDGQPVDAIAAEAGVSKMTVYSHFPSKGDLFIAAVALRTAELMGTDMPELDPLKPKQALTAVGRAFLRAFLPVGSSRRTIPKAIDLFRQKFRRLLLQDAILECFCFP